METPKEKAIKAAYGELYKKHKPDENGWVKWNIKNDFGEENVESKVKGNKLIYRLKILRGIETNNSWTRIESESDLPKPKGVEDVLVITETGEITVENSMSLNDIEVRRYWLRTISHWQPFIKPNLPLY
ncbi:hypothetical protein AB9J70_06265 [Elizabethkingia anophelis]|uniref:hypothetical protein n=1 Tax=Elizabethkingia anophelis TaxID=1117645 RepID=UPI0035584741